MNMKKLMAGVVAGALAVSTLAASAFAADFPAKQSGAKYYTVKLSSGDGTEVTPNGAGDEGKIAVVWDIPAGVEVLSYNITANYFAGEGASATSKDVTIASSTDKATGQIKAEVEYAAGKVLRKGLGNWAAGTTVVIAITAEVSTTADLTKGDNFVENTWKGMNDIVGQPMVQGDVKTGEDIWNGIWLGNSDKAVEKTGKDVYLSSFKVGDVLKTGDMRNFVKGGKLSIDIDASTLDKSVIGSVSFKNGANVDDSTVELLFVSGTTHYEVPIPADFIAYDEVGEGFRADIVTADDAEIVIEGLDEIKSDGNGVGFSVFLSNDAAQPSNPAGTGTSDTSDTQVSEDDPTNTSASDTQAPASSDDNGNTNAGTGDDKNQPTGVALAVIPAIVAAAGVVIAKKRG